MAKRTLKHEHVFAILAHNLDWVGVLVGCQARGCTHVEVWNRNTFRVKIAERKYRPQTAEEFRQIYSALAHLCCV